MVLPRAGLLPLRDVNSTSWMAGIEALWCRDCRNALASIPDVLNKPEMSSFYIIQSNHKKNYTLNQNFNNIYLNKKVNVLYMIQLSKIDNFIKCIALQLWLYSEK